MFLDNIEIIVTFWSHYFKESLSGWGLELRGYIDFLMFRF